MTDGATAARPTSREPELCSPNVSCIEAIRLGNLKDPELSEEGFNQQIATRALDLRNTTCQKTKKKATKADPLHGRAEGTRGVELRAIAPR